MPTDRDPEPPRSRGRSTAEAAHRAGRPGHERSAVPRLVRGVAIAAVVLVVSAATVTMFAVKSVADTFQRRAVDISNGSTATEAPPSIGQFTGAFNVLLVGADNSSGQSGFGESRSATLNDVNMVIHISADHTSGYVISLPRDLVIDQPACTDPTTKAESPAVTAEPLNTSISRGGLGCVVATVEQQTGLKIPYAALFSFEGTVAMADAVGGVQVCATAAIDDPDSGLKLKKGVSTISGRMALAYLRDRHGIGDGSDLGRIASQQAYMSSLLRKMTSSSTLTDPATLYSLASAAAHDITLSKSLADPDTMVTMMLAVAQIPLNTMVFVQYPTVADPADSNKVVPNTALAATLLDRVKHDEAITLSTSNLGVSAVAAPSTASSPTGTPTPTPSSGSSATKGSQLAGVTGQTAAERTCSVAAAG